MSEPTCVQKAPMVVDLQPGRYWWCACGLSARQPFCDGSHKGTNFTPVAFEVDEAKKMWLCACKRTHTTPACDGTHKSL